MYHRYPLYIENELNKKNKKPLSRSTFTDQRY